MAQFVYKWADRLIQNEIKNVVAILSEAHVKGKGQFYMVDETNHNTLFRADTLPEDILKEIYTYMRTQLERRTNGNL